MKHLAWLIAACLAIAPVAARSDVVQFASPAGDLPAEHLHDAVYDAVLPSGRIVTPAGESVVSGINALGMALVPGDRFAIVSNDDAGASAARSAVDPHIAGGYSLAVVDTATMRVVDRYANETEQYFAGVVAVSDPGDAGQTLVFAAGGPDHNVYVFDLDANGRLTPDVHHIIPMWPPADTFAAIVGGSFPASLVATSDGGRIYVVDSVGSSVATIDTASRAVITVHPGLGFRPFGAALAGDSLLVANEGLMRYAQVDPSAMPPFGAPPPDPLHASSLAVVRVRVAGDPAPPPALDDSHLLAMDAAPDGLHIVGGAHPSAIAVTPDAAYAFVAMTNVDRIATVRLGAEPAVVGGTELRLFDRGPYGTQPAALALSHDGTRLYVALSGLNAIAVLDTHEPLHPHRLGLIPTGWFPSALALSADDRMLYALNTKGFGHDRDASADPPSGGDPGAVWSTLQKIDLRAIGLTATTYTALKNTRQSRPAAAPVYPAGLRNVVVILQPAATFDALLGDLGYGPADPRFVRFGAAVTPNLHALARRFAVAGNLFADTDDPDEAHAFGGSGIATAYCERTLPAVDTPPAWRGHGQDPDDYPRAGYIYHGLARHGVSFRDYGDWLRVSGYDAGAAAGAAGGRYGLNVPVPAVLAGNVDGDYPGWNPNVSNEHRAQEFIRDYTALVRAGRQPRYTQIYLPGATPDRPTAADAADGDRALGAIVEFVSRLPTWRQTAIFVMPDAASPMRDHVDANRTFALVVSPFAKPRYVGMRHLSTASVLKTGEQILHVPPLALGDLFATDMSDYFSRRADRRPFDARAVAAQNAGKTSAGDAGGPANERKPEP